MGKEKLLKRCIAVGMAVAISISGLHGIENVQASGTDIQAGIYGSVAEGKNEVQAEVRGKVAEAPDTVDLTRSGSSDWVHFNSKEPGFWERKNRKEPMISQVELLGEPENLVKDTKPNFTYQDGTDQAISPEDNHIGLILYSMDNGVRFQVPASAKEQLLRLYIGSWASEATVTVFVNGSSVYEETYGKKSTEPGGQYYEHEIRYKTPSDQDKVEVQLKTTELYDQRWGNINIDAIALAESGGKTEVSAEMSVLEDQREIQLTQEGNVDWMYFNSADLMNYEYKNLPASYLKNVTPMGETSGITADKYAFFRYDDGTLNETNSSSYKTEKKGIIFNHAGNGMSFDVAGSTHERTLCVYTGAYQATIGMELYLNDEKEPLVSKEYTRTASMNTVLQVRFQTEYPEDVLHVRIYVKEVTDSAYGSVNVVAATLYDENPPEIDVPDYSEEMLGSEEGSIQLNHAKGIINSLQFKEKDGNWLEVPFRTAGAYAGPSWKVNGTALKVKRSADDAHTYIAQKDGIAYGIHYSISEEGILTVTASMKNDTEQAFSPERASIVLGLNTYMQDTYDSYKGLFFPTLLRCEKTHLWGYVESPEKKVVSLAVDSPVSSYHLEYESGQHRIQTAVLDLMQKDETLPERHPRDNYILNPGESRSWNIKMKVSENVESVKRDVEQMLQAPTIDADRYTLGTGEKSNLRVYSSAEPSPIQVTAPDGSASQLPLEKVNDGIYQAQFAPNTGMGVYKLTVQAGEYRAEAMITLRQTWKWYMQKAKEAAISHPAKGADCAESWYNLYTAYLGEKYFPDETQKKQIDDKFEEIYERVICYNENGVPANNPNRIQNHSTTIGILSDKFEAQGDVQDLIRATKIAEYLMSKQDASTGAYIGPTGDYTSVIYPAKSMMELMKQEAKLIAQGDNSYNWQECYDKHYDSVKRAMDNLVRLKGDLHTEGQLTFEDGAFSCSATQLSEFALMHAEGSPEREKYMQSALGYLNKHQALEQEIIPDSRTNGGSLRFWEAQYDVLLTANPNNMMNSPHGWTAWNIYGFFNMYQLTGDEYYLRKGMNAIGSCAQLMGLDGNLNWAFIADPYIKGSLFVQKENDTSQYGEGTRESVTLGESYVDMISDWWRTPPDTNVGGYYGQGGACDNDVHEIFKCMEETVLTKAYVVEQENGAFMGYNCSVSQEESGKLLISTIDGEITDEINLNLKSNNKYEIYFANTGRTKSGIASAGMSAVKDEENSLAEKRENAVNEIKDYKNMQDYRSEQIKEIQQLITKWQAVIENAETEAEIVQAAVDAKAELDLVLTDAQMTETELREAKSEAKRELENYKNPNNYREEQRNQLLDAVEEGMEAIDRAGGQEEVRKVLAEAKLKLDRIPTDEMMKEDELASVKQKAMDELEKYQDATNYRDAQKTELEKAIRAGIQAIQSASTKEDVEKAVVQAKAVIDMIPDNAALTAREVSGVSLNAAKITLDRGGSYVLKAVISPATAVNTSVSYRSSNRQVAKVSANGTVKAGREGNAVITVTTADGNKIARCKVTVNYKGKWVKNKKGYRFKRSNGKYLKNAWKTVGRKFTYIGKNGYRLTGKKKIGKAAYFFNKKGIMKTGFKKIGKNTCYFGKDGKMVTGLQTIKKKQYYFNKKGIMQTGICA